MSGLTIGRFEIREELGEGGMGTVYLAYDPTLGREVALKVLQPQLTGHDPQFSMRFEREARTVASLEHSSIVSLYELGEDGEWLYIVMRLMEGGTLSERLEKGRLSLEETIDIVLRIGSALDKAHSRGIVHRDLKPGNILFDEEGDAYLSDFGIVKVQDATGLKTRTDQTLGTPHYMSPEQLEGEEVDGRSDIYSLGIILYEMLSGSRPYDDKSTARVIVMQLTAPVPSIVQTNPDLPPELEAVINKAMAKDPQERYGTAGEMIEALQGVTAKQSAARAAVVVAAAMEMKPEADPSAKTLVALSPIDPQMAPQPEATPVTKTGEEPSVPVSESKKKGGLPGCGCVWWAAAVVVMLLLIFGILAVFALGSNEAQKSIAELGDAIAAIVPAATVTDTAVPPTLSPSATLEPTDMPRIVNPTETALVASRQENTATIVPGPTATLKPPTLTVTVTPKPADTTTPTPSPTATLEPPILTATVMPQPANAATLTPSPTATGNTIGLPPLDATLGTVWERPRDQMVMVYVPAGTFRMGSEEGGSDEQQVHDVTLDDFWIDETEITNAHYTQCLGAGVCEASSYADDSTYNGDDVPVVGVSWNDANTYCSWAGGQLPTEAQWEYAARGPEENRYPWGEEEPTCELAQYGDCEGSTVPVGSFLEGASWAGALDMVGNVWEWVNDWYDGNYYANSAAENPAGPESGDYKVQRGGSWRNRSVDLLGASRIGYGPAGRNIHIGFRCVLSGR